MNIHEHQAKDILREYGVPVSKGVVIFSENEIEEKIKDIKSKNIVLKAQIHAGGRGKAGGVKILKNDENLINEVKKMFGKTLITHQTGPQGKKVKRLLVEKQKILWTLLVDKKTPKLRLVVRREVERKVKKIQKIIINKIDLRN